MSNKFCPFIKSECREDCVFKYHKVASGNKVYDCLIAIKLSDINDMQHDDLAAIWNALRER